MFVICDEDSFSYNLASGLGVPCKPFTHNYRQDGEPYPRICAAHNELRGADYNELKGKRMILVLRGEDWPDRDKISRNIHNHLRLTGNLAFMYEAASVDIVMPYYWMCRQDKDPRTDEDPEVREKDKGLDIGCEYLAREFKANGARRIITFSPHFLRDFDGALKEGKVKLEQRGSTKVYVKENFGAVDIKNDDGNVTVHRDGIDVFIMSGVPPLAKIAKEKEYKNAVIVGSDLRATPLGIELATELSMEGVSLPKKRLSDEEVRHDGKFDAGGRDVIVIDDIWSTLKTLRSTVRSIRNHGEIDVYAVHAVLPEIGHVRLKDMDGEDVRKFVTTNTIRSSCPIQGDVLPYLLEFFKNE